MGKSKKSKSKSKSSRQKRRQSRSDSWASLDKPPPVQEVQKVNVPPGQGFRALTERWTAPRVEQVVELLHRQDRRGLQAYLASDVPQHVHISDPIDKLDLKGFHFSNLHYRLDLGRVHFKGLNLWSCRFEDVNLKDAVFEDCSLGLSSFVQAYLRNVRFINCDLLGSSFEHSILDDVRFEGTQLRFCSWTDSKIDVGALPEVLEEEKKGRYDAARDIFKALRLNLQQIGDEAGASWATYRQCVMDRKHLWHQKHYLSWLKSWVLDLLWGYGERPARLFFFSLLFCSLCALGYFTFGVTYEGKCASGLTMAHPTNYFWRCLYFSFVTFTTLGYGDLAPCSPMSRFVASLEAFSGVFIMGLFVTANVRKLAGR